MEKPPEDIQKAVDESIKEHNKEIKINRGETPEDKPAVENEPEKEKTVKELSDEAIEEHNKEVRERKEAAPEKALSSQNKKKFEKLEDDEKEMISSTYDNFSVGFKDRYKLVRSEKLYNHHERKKLELEREAKNNKADIAKIEADLDEHNQKMTAIREQFPEGLDKKAEIADEKEKKRLRKYLKAAKTKEIDLQSKQETNQRKRKEYETSRDEIIERIELFVGDKITPYEEKLPELQEELAELDTKIEGYKNNREKFAKELESWNRKVSEFKDIHGEMPAAGKITFDKKIKEIEKEISDADSNVNLVQKDRNVVNGRINGLVVKIDYWNTVLEKSKGGGVAKYPEKYAVDTEGKPVEARAEEVVADEIPEVIEEEVTTPEIEKAESPKGYEAWREAVMPSKEKEQNINVGDEVLWESQGVLQWKEPRKIVSIEEDPQSKKMYALFEGETTGAPLEELVLSQKTSAQEKNIEETEEERFTRKEFGEKESEIREKEIALEQEKDELIKEEFGEREHGLFEEEAAELKEKFGTKELEVGDYIDKWNNNLNYRPLYFIDKKNLLKSLHISSSAKMPANKLVLNIKRYIKSPEYRKNIKPVHKIMDITGYELEGMFEKMEKLYSDNK